MEFLPQSLSLVLTKYHHSHSSFSLSDSLVILYCYEMPKCLQASSIYLFTHCLSLEIVMNPITPPTPSFIGRQHAHFSLQCVLFGDETTPGQPVCGKQMQFHHNISLLSKCIQLNIPTVCNRHQDDMHMLISIT